MQQAADEKPEIISFNQEPLVSVDYRRSPFSSVVDGLSTMVTGGNLVRVISWYDNEWSYSCRVADLALYIKKKEMEEKEVLTAGDRMGGSE